MSGRRKKETGTSLGHEAPDRWTFDESVTQVFGDMLKRSIPQYAEMRRLVFDTGRRFVRPGTGVLDLGCSKGDSLAPFVTEFGDCCHYLGLELSGPMLAAARERFQEEIGDGFVRIEKHDICQGLPAFNAGLVLSVLTLQFTPPEQRLKILREVHDSLHGDGALIIVEKVLGQGPRMDALMVDVHHDLKASHGYTREEVDRKRLSLDGVLVPLSAADNGQLLEEAGFSEIDCFWRWMNFSAWLALA